jgi:hypothetical protein
MTESPDEYGEVLRRVLRAEAESVVHSAEGLQIIRARVDQRGMRGIFWWRAAASAFGAVLVAATVVMVVPGLRDQFNKDDPRSIVPVQYDTSPPDESSTRRPPPGVRLPPAGSQGPVSSPSTGTTPFLTPKPSATASPGDDCATSAPVPTTSDPDAAQACASPTATPSQPEATGKPKPTPTPTPTKTTPKPTASPRPSRTPTATPSQDPPCDQCSAAPSETPPPPSITPQMTTDVDTSAT